MASLHSENKDRIDQTTQPFRQALHPRFLWRLSILIGLILFSFWSTNHLRAQGRIIRVDNVDDLYAAVANAQAGDTIIVEGQNSKPYAMRHKLLVNRPGQPDAPITLKAKNLDDVELQFFPATGIVEGIHVVAPHWRFENLSIRGMCNENLHSSCEHAYHIVGAADGTVVRNGRMVDFNAQIKGNGNVGPDPSGAYIFPDDVLIEGNEFYSKTPRQTRNPVTPIDVVGGRRWIIRANYIHDFAKAGGNKISYAAFLKGNSRDGLFERNLVACEQLHRGQIRLGLSFGGGGTSPDRICEDQTCSPEHQRGMMRNNIIANCPQDVGIYLNEAFESRVDHNLIFNAAGIDVRFAASSVSLQGNILQGRIRERDGGLAQTTNNLAQVSDSQFETWFKAPDDLDFSLLDGQAFVDKGTPLEHLTDDYCDHARDDGTPDLGPIEFDASGGCDTSRIHPRPTPTPTPTIADAITIFGLIENEAQEAISGATIKIECGQFESEGVSDAIGAYRVGINSWPRCTAEFEVEATGYQTATRSLPWPFSAEQNFVLKSIDPDPSETPVATPTPSETPTMITPTEATPSASPLLFLPRLETDQ